MRMFTVAVIGGSDCDRHTEKQAFEVGRTVAKSGSVLLSGGMEGVMEAACRGAKKEQGLTVGIIPGKEHSQANEYVDIVIPTGLGNSRNTLVAGSADIIVALKGSYGTLSEICFALIGKVSVYGLDSWDLPDVEKIHSVSGLERVIAKHKKDRSIA